MCVKDSASLEFNLLVQLILVIYYNSICVCVFSLCYTKCLYTFVFVCLAYVKLKVYIHLCLCLAYVKLKVYIHSCLCVWPMSY